MQKEKNAAADIVIPDRDLQKELTGI